MYEQLLIDEASACDLLAVRPTQLRRMVDRGEVPCRLLPNREKRFDPEELRQWAAQLQHVETVPA